MSGGKDENKRKEAWIGALKIWGQCGTLEVRVLAFCEKASSNPKNNTYALFNYVADIDNIFVI